MGKRLLNLYVEDCDIEMLKAKKINMSQLFRAMLSTELNLGSTTPSGQADELKLEVTKLKVELERLKGINEKLQKEVEDARNRSTRRYLPQ